MTTGPADEPFRPREAEAPRATAPEPGHAPSAAPAEPPAGAEAVRKEAAEAKDVERLPDAASGASPCGDRGAEDQARPEMEDRGAGRGPGAGRDGAGETHGTAPRAQAPADGGAHVLYVRFHPTVGGATPGLGEDVYQGLLALLGEVTPVVEALPPDAALADVRGALRYFGRDATGLAEVVRVRALARYGVDCTVGVAASPLLARMAAHDAATRSPGSPSPSGASGEGGAGGAVRTVPDDPDAVVAFLARKPPTALPGVGPATARTLCSYGLDSAARIADAPLSTLQRILGAATARRVHAWARGIDPAPVTPNAPARAMGAEHRFRRDELDPVRRRRALLTLADGLGARLRTSGQVAAALTLTVRYADRSSTTRGRTLTEPTAHTPVLTATAYALHDALGLQRARVRSVSLRVEGLMDAELASHQLSFDPADDKSRRLEAAADQARARFGASAVRPAGFLDVA